MDIDFQKLVAQTQKDVTDLTNPNELWQSKAFITIAANSRRFQSAAGAFIASGTASEEQKEIAVYGMQTLSDFDYIAFFTHVCAWYVDQKCSDKVLALTILPGNNWNSTIVRNYKSEVIASKLQSLMTGVKSSETIKALAPAVISGEAYNSMLEYLDSQDDRGAHITYKALEQWTAGRVPTNR
jgi:hypothetical protein